MMTSGRYFYSRNVAFLGWRIFHVDDHLDG
nr:MAG TPA: hypothetical protein [Inoviridae sp.]